MEAPEHRDAGGVHGPRARAAPAHRGGLALGALLSATVRRAAGWRVEAADASAALLRQERRHLPPMRVSADAARLVHRLRRPVPATALVDAAGAATLAGLVLDGIVELRDGQGRWVAGAAAAAALGAAAPAVPDTPLARVSAAALRHAASIGRAEPERVAHALYAFGSVPIAPRLLAALPPAARLARREPGGDGGTTWAALGWRAGAARASGWIHWNGPGMVPPRGGRTWKLYVSPACDDVEDAVATTARVVARSGACALKVGRPLHGLLRPDKLVAYFASADELHRTAAELRDVLHDALGVGRAHGVPFTAPVTPDGLLSWGVDPPVQVVRTAAGGMRSWRAWVTARLAAFLRVGLATGDGELSPEDFARFRLSHEHGVDTTTWAPPPTLWARS